jgi:hypothetical protein
VLIEAMLQSPAFLYHWEAPATPPIARARWCASGLRDRLAPLLLPVGLDAGHGPVRRRGGRQAGRRPTSRRRPAAAGRPAGRATPWPAFFGSWLELDISDEKAAKDPKVYPEYTDALKTAMAAETRAFVNDVVFDGDGRWGTLLGGSFSFVNQALAVSTACRWRAPI